jgi:hypothetical protein
MKDRTELAKRVLHFNKLWKEIPQAVVETHNAFFDNEDFWSEQPEYRWSTPYLWSEKGTA